MGSKADGCSGRIWDLYTKSGIVKDLEQRMDQDVTVQNKQQGERGEKPIVGLRDKIDRDGQMRDVDKNEV